MDKTQPTTAGTPPVITPQKLDHAIGFAPMGVTVVELPEGEIGLSFGTKEVEYYRVKLGLVQARLMALRILAATDPEPIDTISHE